jgi:hypothetical protein
MIGLDDRPPQSTVSQSSVLTLRVDVGLDLRLRYGTSERLSSERLTDRGERDREARLS